MTMRQLIVAALALFTVGVFACVALDQVLVTDIVRWEAAAFATGFGTILALMLISKEK